MRSKLIMIFLMAKVIPLILLTIIAWQQIVTLGNVLREIAVTDSSKALNDSAVENIERMSTDTAKDVADFLYSRDDDIRYVATLDPTEENYRDFVEVNLRKVVKKGDWELNAEGTAWVEAEPPKQDLTGGVSTNLENNDMDGFHYRPAETFQYKAVPLYDEIAFIDLQGNEVVKYVSPNSTKIHHPFDRTKRNVSQRENTYVKAETYFAELQKLKPGEIYVSDVVGAYVGSNYIGMYAPAVVEKAAADRGYDIPFQPEGQAYAGKENPNGQRFEGIVRWAMPVADENGGVKGYVTFALNHDHIMEFVDHITPMNQRYTQLSSAFEGNYAFIWDYKCRSICHPRHHSIVGFNPETGDPETPWLETSIYEAWQQSGVAKWSNFVDETNWPIFDQQSRTKKPALALTKAGLVGLDGRYLNNAPQCTGWMDLTERGGSGSFYILWSGLYKLNTAAAIPYYTGHYAPSEENDFSKRGFGFVAIGAGLDDFTRPARETEIRLETAASATLNDTFTTLFLSTSLLIVLVVTIAILLASSITGNITHLIKGISRFRAGERQFRFETESKDEFGTLADSFDDMADSIVDSVKNPLSITDMEQRIIYMNEPGLKFNHLTLQTAVGRPYGECSVYPTGSKYDPILALEQGREADIFFVERTRRYIRGVANFFLSKEGEKIGYIIETNDMTEMVLDQLALEQAVSDANRANQHKGEFLARMSHEIRTPMNAIIGLANIVQRKLGGTVAEKPEITEVKDHVRQIEVSSQHLLGLLNDILDLSKIEAGKIELSQEAMELPKLSATVASIIKPRCDEKNIAFETNFEAFTPATLMGDPLRLRQVLINLLGNAVKFTPELGSIYFSVARRERKDGMALIEFAVRDTGIGISEETLKTIFQPFEQADRSISKQYGGTGLGLSISHHIVQLFGGEIQVTSQLGKGSEFRFSIWLRELEESDGPTLEALDVTGKFGGRRALVVDDVEINRMIVNSLLESTGMASDEAADGDEAVEKFAGSLPGTYDVIFMDIQMPKMDGYEAALAIRALNHSDAKTVPIVALTANAFKEDIDKALENGMNAHITKPVDMDRLAEVLVRFVRTGKG